MNRQPKVVALILALVATASLVVAAQVPRFTSVTDETLRSPAPANWPAWRRDRAGTGYSPPDQINRSSVRRLRLAWASTLEVGSLEPEPLVFNGVMYVPHPGDIVQVLDARNGTMLWEYRRERSKDARGGGLGVSRNLALYQDRVSLGTSDAHLVALDVRSGKVAWDVAVADSRQGKHATRNCRQTVNGLHISLSNRGARKFMCRHSPRRTRKHRSQSTAVLSHAGVPTVVNCSTSRSMIV
jgi:alcohol dehydrogenase (cytochrome c)